MINLIFWLIWGVILFVVSITSYKVESLFEHEIPAYITALHICVGYACAKFMNLAYSAGEEIAKMQYGTVENQDKTS